MKYFDLLKFGAPEAILVLTALVVLAIGLRGRRANVFAAVVAAAGIVGAIVSIFFLPASATLFNGMLVISPLTSLAKIICLVLTLFALGLSRAETQLRHRSEQIGILLFAAVGLMLLVGSEELLTIFIGLELLGLSLYVLTAFDKIDNRSAEAGMKYFLFGSTASAFTLFGISLTYGMARTTSLAAIGPAVATMFSSATWQPLLLVGVIMTLVGFAFKIAAAPFHLWAPDTYQAAPVSTAAFVASASKVASFVVLGKILLIGFVPVRGNAGWHAMVGGWSPLLAILAALSILLGNFAALAQTNVRRLLAYSAVAHAGYALLGLVTASPEGFSATLFYATVYALTLVGAFGVVGVVRQLTGGDDIRNFAGLSRRSPLLAASMAVFMLSLAGLPPLAGFFGKFYLFSTALNAGGNHGLLWLVAIALFGSLVSLYYYLLVLKAVFIDPTPASTTPPASVLSHPILIEAVVAVAAAGVLLLGIMPTALVARIVAALS